MAHSERDGSQPRAPHKSMGEFTENKGVTLDMSYEIRPVSAPPSQPATPVQPSALAANAPVSGLQGDASVKE